MQFKTFQIINDIKLTDQYYSKVKNEHYKHKEAVLTSLQTNSLSLRMTRYVYEPSFKYHAIYRIRNNFKVNTIGYFD